MSRAAPVPLLPKEDAREAALYFVVGALCFLAALSGLFARSAWSAADAWTDRVTGEITIRIRGTDQDAARALTIVQETPGVASARALSRSDAVALLRPWLGASGVPGGPVPSPSDRSRRTGRRRDRTGSRRAAGGGLGPRVGG
jgi:cell division transport system permease protein